MFLSSNFWFLVFGHFWPMRILKRVQTFLPLLTIKIFFIFPPQRKTQKYFEVQMR
jgi:hypothetical protein